MGNLTRSAYEVEYVFETAYEVCLRMIDRDELRPHEPLTLALRSEAKVTCVVEE